MQKTINLFYLISCVFFLIQCQENTPKTFTKKENLSEKERLKISENNKLEKIIRKDSLDQKDSLQALEKNNH